MQQWAEIRAMKAVEGLSIKEITRRTGHSRNTIRQILRSPEPPSYGPRAPRPSKLDPHKPKIHELLRKDPVIPSQVIRERITCAGYGGGKTILDDYVRELRPIFAPPRTFQRTHYEPGELVQFDWPGLSTSRGHVLPHWDLAEVEGVRHLQDDDGWLVDPWPEGEDVIKLARRGSGPTPWIAHTSVDQTDPPKPGRRSGAMSTELHLR